MIRALVTRAAQRWLDKHARSPRLVGFSQDDGMPDRGERYGGAGTIHNSGTIDVVLGDDGTVTEVWFRCMQLAARVGRRSDPLGEATWLPGAHLVAVETAEPEHGLSVETPVGPMPTWGNTSQLRLYRGDS